MYSTTAYLYQQIQSVLMIDTSGDYFDKRWKPVYSKNLKLNLGVDNVILFQFLNQDQKPVNITGTTLVFRIISQNGKDLLYSREMTALNAANGRAKVTIPSADTKKLQADVASWSIEYVAGDLKQAVFTDDYSGARGTIDIVDSVYPAFSSSRTLTIPDQAPQDNVYYSSVISTDGESLVTLQLDTGAFSGTLRVQGSNTGTSQTAEWYDIDFENLKTQTTVSQIVFTNSTDRHAINISGYHPSVRLSLTIDSGTVDQILYR